MYPVHLIFFTLWSLQGCKYHLIHSIKFLVKCCWNNYLAIEKCLKICEINNMVLMFEVTVTLNNSIFICCFVMRWLKKRLCVSQTVKNLPAVQETWAQSLGWEDPLEKKMATHSITLAWRFSWAEEHGGLQSTGSQSWTWLSD